jgi:mono/diheme cytochrome c family protein
VARESLRKPYVAGQYVYSNQVIARDVPGMGIHSEIPLIERRGFQASQVFMPERLRQVSPHNAVEVGHSLALTTCSNCHSLSATGMRPLAGYFGGNHDVDMIKTYLQGALGTGNTIYMPHIPLNDAEAGALARFIVSLQPAASKPSTLRTAAAFNASKE